jgi:uncharacterized protein (DUF433 family)
MTSPTGSVPINALGSSMIDWTECHAIETSSGRLSGQPVIRHSRVRSDDLVVNREQGVEWMAEHHRLPMQTVLEVLAFYDGRHQPRA